LKKSLPRTLINGHPVRQSGNHNLQKLGNEGEAQTIPTIVNGVTMKTNSKYNMEISGTPINPINDCIDNLQDTVNGYNKSVHLNTDMPRVVLIGDSRIKGFENLLRSMFNREYYLFSLLQPGSNSNIPKESVKEAVKQLYMNDFLVISRGTSNFDSDNFTSTFQNISNYLRSITNTNILLLSIPYRFDLPIQFAVNKKIIMLNNKLQKLVRKLPHTSFLDSNNGRQLFTRHGLHRNKLGKRLVTSNSLSYFGCFQHKVSSSNKKLSDKSSGFDSADNSSVDNVPEATTKNTDEEIQATTETEADSPTSSDNEQLQIQTLDDEQTAAGINSISLLRMMIVLYMIDLI
jgi:hypothetical protein